MLSFFRTQPLLDPASANWMFDTFEWAIRHFDQAEFFQRTRLIQPTSSFFPGRVNSAHERAENIFRHTADYMGLGHWPFEVQAPQYFQNMPPQLIGMEQIQRQSGDSQLPSIVAQMPLTVSYIPDQTTKPEDLSATFAHLIAKHALVQSQQLPPGGQDYFNEATEILAVFMGFGVLVANTAYTYRGGCGSCYNAAANRQASLTEDDVVFALALFCRLKDIPEKDATKYLKKYLKNNFKRALKQVDSEEERLQELKSLTV